MGNITTYCLKCKSKQEMKEPKESTFKNGTPIIVGICLVCGNKIFKIVSKNKKE